METVAAKSPGKWRRRLLYGSALFVLLVLGVAIALPNFVKARTTSCKNACINNLRQIDGAKEQWALEHKKASGVPVIDSEVDSYIKGGRPICPAGGKYTYHNVDEPPTCSANDKGVIHSL